MTKIAADDLDKQQFVSLLQFLTSRSGSQIVPHGSTLDIDGPKSREVKLLLHKFLHLNGLNDYRVLSHEGVLEIVHLKQEQRREERQGGLKPTMPGPIDYSAIIPHTVKPSDMIEWSSHPWERKSSSRKKS